MAGDWIKLKTDLATDPAVIAVAGVLGLEEDLVVGKLCRLWSWANTHTENGHASGVTPGWLNRFLGCDNFATALAEVGWLEIKPDGLEIPRFERHNGKSAKTRATARERKRREREVSRNRRDNGHAPGVTETGHAFDREEKSNRRQTTTPPDPPPTWAGQDETFQPCPVWKRVGGDLVALGIFDPQPAIESARQAGASPEDVGAILDHAQSMPGAWGPGAIRNRVANAHPDLAPDQGWPAAAADYEAQRAAFLKEEERRGQLAKQAVEDARLDAAKLAAGEREAEWGPVLDSMAPDELDQLVDDTLGQTGPAVSHYRRHGATGMVRGILLLGLDERGEA